MPPASDLIPSLYRIGSLARKGCRPRDALEIALDEICRATGAPSGSIALIDPASGRLQIEVQRGLPRDCDEVALKIGEGITGWVALHGKAVVVPDVSLDPRYRQVSIRVRSEMVAPIENKGQIIGVVSMNGEKLNAFGEQSLEKLVALTNETGALLEQLWLTEGLQTKAGHLEAVLTVGQGIASRLDRRQILESITRETVPISGCDFCAIHLLNEDGTKLLRQAAAGEHPDNRHPDLPINETSAGVALQRRKQVEVTDLFKTEGLLPLLEFAQARGLVSLLCTPIAFEDRPLGILSAYTGKAHRFSDDERKLFAAMAGLGAVAIHNARLYERVFQTEETLRHQEKLSALGLLAAEIAHEVRNPLTVLKLLFSSLNLRFPNDDPRQKDVEVIEEKLNQLEETVGRVLAFARPSEAAHTLCSIEETVADTLQLIRLKSQQAGIRIVFTPGAKTPPVRADKGQLQQALLNLLLNSLQAVDNGGRIELRTAPESHDGQPGACLEIEDTGRGIPEELQAEIFKSLLTGHAEGTGLGLGIVKRIVESHRGRIEIARTGPTGTVMKMWLPE